MVKKNMKWKLLLATRCFAVRFTTSCLGVGTTPQKTHGFQSLPSRTLPRSSRNIKTASRSLESSVSPNTPYHHQSKQSYDSLLRTKHCYGYSPVPFNQNRLHLLCLLMHLDTLQCVL